jgi:hypothetical protein
MLSSAFGRKQTSNFHLGLILKITFKLPQWFEINTP